MADVHKLAAFVFLCLTLPNFLVCVRYEPNWTSLDSRPLPSWYDESKIGIFIHWGVFSVPSATTGEWFWWHWQGTDPDPKLIKFMKDNFRPDFTYGDFAPMFTAEFFDPDQWADIFSASGARYIVFTSKHHEGFTNWPSKYSFNWNSVDVGPNRDLVGDLATSIRTRTKLHFGLYHSLYEWFNPLFLKDQAANFTAQDFVVFKTMPELYEIVNRYKPDVVWSDGDWSAKDTYWNSTQFLAWLYNDSPVKDTVVTNDRWGAGDMCHHGGFLTCADNYNPGVLQKRKWENAMTIDRNSWGYRRPATLADYRTVDELIDELVVTVSCGGNILLNVGPNHEGRILPVFEERLRQLGSWLGVNGEAIYTSRPWIYQNDTEAPDVWYTSKNNTQYTTDVYAIVLKWPQKTSLFLAAPIPTGQTRVTLLGYPTDIGWKAPATRQTGMELEIPIIPFSKMPCDWAWVFKLEKLKNQNSS